MVQVLCAEEHPTHEHYDKCIDKRRFAQLCQPLTKEQPLRDQEKAVVCAPYHISPFRAMPEAGCQEYKPEIEEQAQLTVDPVATQRNVEVSAHPVAQGDVPPAPEVGNGYGRIRIIEIFRETEAHHLSQADGHIGIAGKVEVYLEGVADGTKPRGIGAEVGRRKIKDGVGRSAHYIGYQHLFAQAQAKAVQPPEFVFGGL